LTDTEVYQETHYYPFGMTMEGEWQDIVTGPENNYLYNGKELNTDFGLDWLDYGGRWYDPNIGRFTTTDLLAELDHNMPLTPYHYVANNPISNIDPDGFDWYKNNESGEVHWQKGSDDLDGHEKLGAYYIHEGEDNYVVHYQQDVIATVSKNDGGDWETAYTRQIEHMTVEKPFKDHSRDVEILLATGELIQMALLTFAPGVKGGKGRAFKPFVTNGKSVNLFLDGLKKLPATKGKTTLYQSAGGFKQALKDMKSLGGKIKKIIVTQKGNVYQGQLSDGRTIIARPFSSTKGGGRSQSTLEIRNARGRGFEVRY